MIVGDSRIIAPSIFKDETWSEAEVLGGMVWLWSQHEQYAKVAIDVALDTLLPLINSQNFAFFIHNGSPIGYVNWAFLNSEQEQQYLDQLTTYKEVLALSQAKDDTRIWLLTLFSPTGKSSLIKRLMREVVLPREEVRFMRIKSTETSPKVMCISGYQYK